MSASLLSLSTTAMTSGWGRQVELPAAANASRKDSERGADKGANDVGGSIGNEVTHCIPRPLEVKGIAATVPR